MTTMTWNEKALAATHGSRFGAIIACALGHDTPAPRFHGKASVTSDGYVMCNFERENGERHMGALVGSLAELEGNIAGLAAHLELSREDRAAFGMVLANWIGSGNITAARTRIRAAAKVSK